MSRKYAGTAKPPFLPDFCDQKSKHPRKVSEDEVQQTVVDVFECFKRPGVERITIHNNPRSPRDGARFNRMGGQRGVSDLLFIKRVEFPLETQVFWLELKTESGRASPEQIDFQNRMIAVGCFAAVAKGIDHAIKILRSWDLITGRVQ